MCTSEVNFTSSPFSMLPIKNDFVIRLIITLCTLCTLILYYNIKMYLLLLWHCMKSFKPFL